MADQSKKNIKLKIAKKDYEKRKLEIELEEDYNEKEHKDDNPIGFVKDK